MILHCPQCNEPVEIVAGEVRCGLCGYLLGLSPGPSTPHAYPRDPVPDGFGRGRGWWLIVATAFIVTLAGLLYFG